MARMWQGLSRVDASPTESSIGAADGSLGRLVTIEIGPAAVEVGVGERLRLHICSAAHPRWMRNLCASPEVPLARQMSGDQAVCHVRVSVDESCAALWLPLIDLEACD